ncbi:MAG: hypothetical protein IPL35_01560 [Sphingobacteriales bacterium]|nr:hypothetical protein [Sphingobacteriales bacterium]
MITVKMPIALIATFLWIGFVCAISFMEAWLKFRAPGITVQLGLGIGRLVFSALNKVEWVLAIAILLNLILSKSIFLSVNSLLYFIPLILLIIQTTWTLPALDTRPERHIKAQIPAAPNLQLYYVGMEIIKVACLSIFGISLFKNKSI